MNRTTLRLLLLALSATSLTLAAPIGLNDTFQSGTTENWFAGGLGGGQLPPVPPAVQTSGGPAGAGDAFLVITSQGGQGPGSRLVAMNATQWAGDYLASQVATISMDLINLGATDLTIRLLFEDPQFGPPANIAISSLGFILPAGGPWVHAVFPVAPSELTAVVGSSALALSGTTLLRIIHSTSGTEATPVAGILGVDNIQTAAVPEPSTLALAALGLFALAARRLSA